MHKRRLNTLNKIKIKYSRQLFSSKYIFAQLPINTRRILLISSYIKTLKFDIKAFKNIESIIIHIV